MRIPRENIKIALLHPHPLYREGLRALIECDENLRISYEGSLDLDSVKAMGKGEVDVLLLSLDIPPLLFDLLIGFLHEHNNHTRFLALASPGQDERIIYALKGGMHGYVLTTSQGKQLINAIKSVAKGQFWTERRLLGPLLQNVHMDTPLVHFAQRQREVALLLSEGKTDKDIGSQLKMSLPTVRSHLRLIYRKLGVKTRPQAICLILQGKI